MPLTVLAGSSFCVSDEQGDIGDGALGFFANDTRHLARAVLTLEGVQPQLLSVSHVAPHDATFFLRNAIGDGWVHDELLLVRRRRVAGGLLEDVTVRNLTNETKRARLCLDLEVDFADIFSVKERDTQFGDPDRARPLPPLTPPEWSDDRRELVYASDEHPELQTRVVLSHAPDEADVPLAWTIQLEPREEWTLELDLAPGGEDEGPNLRRGIEGRLARVEESLRTWRAEVPRLTGSWRSLTLAYDQAVLDLAALRMDVDGGGRLIAAGAPWFMTVFGRDTIIASIQTMALGGDLAASALRTLASLQAVDDDPVNDAEPGKILHEIRRGASARAWTPCYYGTVDATPLFLVLLHEYWRWTDDRALVRDLLPAALRALRWIDEFGDLDGDGFVEYARRGTGIDNQSWKDSGESMTFSDGRMPVGPIAPVEVQGYVYDAKRRLAELAREVWRDRDLAVRLDREADDLKERFDPAFWCDRRGGQVYALALDGEKRPLDALGSNIGHLLWSGIVPDERVDAVVDLLLGDELWSGWGVRTLASGDAAYNPLTYHNGTVWPHDNSLIALGLVRYGRVDEAHRIARRMVDVASHLGHQLPEVFAGFARSETGVPIVYPTATKPQAWAAGSVVALLGVLLGLEPVPQELKLRTAADKPLPSWAGAMRLTGLRAFGLSWEARVEEHRVTVTQA